MRCGECGSQNVKRSSVVGKSFRWRDFSSVTLSQPLELLVCQECSNYIIKSGEAEKVDAAIEASIFEQSRIAISKIKEAHGCEQKDIAAHLGVTPEHLSEVKSGRKIPSFQLFNFLKILAMDKAAYPLAAPEVHIDFKAAMSVRT